MIQNLPAELKFQILTLQPRLRYANKDFYILHNEVHKMKVLRLLGGASMDKFIHLFELFSSTLEFWNGELTKLYKPDINWVFIYSLFQNRKVFLFEQDFVIQDNPFERSTSIIPQEEASFVHIASAHAFHLHKIIQLPNGRYNFQVALRNQRTSRGLGTTKFKLNYMNETINTYPPSIVHEILPTKKLSVLNLGEFTIDNPKNDLTDVEIIIEEIGMFPKTNLTFDYLDFKPSHNDYLYYSFPDDPVEEYSKVVNIVEKACHLVIEEVLRSDHAHYHDLRFDSDSDSAHMSIPSPQSEDSSLLGVDFHKLFLETFTPEDLKKYAEEYYTSGTRQVKMFYPNDQRDFREEHTGPLLQWKIPLLR